MLLDQYLESVKMVQPAEINVEGREIVKSISFYIKSASKFLHSTI